MEDEMPKHILSKEKDKEIGFKGGISLSILQDYEKIKKESGELNETIIKTISVNVLDVWKTNYDDYRANVEIGNGKIKKGNVIASYDENTIQDLTGNLKQINERELKNAIAILVASDFEKYLTLPKISECSKLLQSIYDDVCASDASMCHISNEDWEDYYIDEYSEKDIEFLKEEVKKYNLDDVIVFDDYGYMITGYGDLETRFNDDRSLKQVLEDEVEL